MSNIHLNDQRWNFPIGRCMTFQGRCNTISWEVRTSPHLPPKSGHGDCWYLLMPANLQWTCSIPSSVQKAEGQAYGLFPDHSTYTRDGTNSEPYINSSSSIVHTGISSDVELDRQNCANLSRVLNSSCPVRTEPYIQIIS